MRRSNQLLNVEHSSDLRLSNVQFVLLLALWVFGFSVPVGADEVFSHHLCNISFEHPAGWRVTTSYAEQEYRGAERHKCKFTLTPLSVDQSSIYELSHYVVVVNSSYQTFVQSALDYQFRFSEGGWKLDPELDGRVESIRLNRWYGLKATLNEGCPTKVVIPDAPGCTEHRYVLGAPYSEEGHMVTVSVPEGGRDAAEMLLKSLRSAPIQPW